MQQPLSFSLESRDYTFLTSVETSDLLQLNVAAIVRLLKSKDAVGYGKHRSRTSRGVNKALDRLEGQIKLYRKALLEITHDRDPGGDIEELAIGTGEVETIEALIRRIAKRVSGTFPDRSEWEPMHPYCSQNEEKKEGWAEQNYEYFRWALLWIKKSRTYLVYLGGLEFTEDEPRDPETGIPEEQHEHNVPRHDSPPAFATEDRDSFRTIAKAEARYIGKIVWTPLPDGRLMELIESLDSSTPADLNGTFHQVPALTEHPFLNRYGLLLEARLQDNIVTHQLFTITTVMYVLDLGRPFIEYSTML